MSTGVDIVVKGLSIGAKKAGTAVLSTIDLQVSEGEALAITGPSGAGKTTLVKALIGEIAPGLHVTGGSITIAGKHPLTMRGQPLRAFRRGCAYVDQDPGAALPPRWTVRRIIRQRARLSDTDMLSLLGEFGLADIDGILDRTPRQLSGGQRRRLGIAAGIAGQPKLLLIDEPTAGVDHAAARIMLDSLKVARKRSGATCVVITHDLKVAEELADRVLMVGGGPQDPILNPTGTPKSSGDADVVLRIDNLTLTQGGHNILSNINLELRRGDIVGITGPSGGGKTTLLRAILGLHAPAQGTITISEPDSVGWIPQESELSLNPAVPVATILRRAAGHHTDSAALADLLHGLNLPGFLRTPRQSGHQNHHQLTRPDELSGGQRQRVNVARALLTRPTLLLADEPTSALDGENSRRVIAAIRTSAENRATIIASHDPSVLAACHRIVSL